MREERLIDVSAGICPLGPSKKVKAAIRKAIRRIDVSPDFAVRRLERLFLSKFGIPAERLLFAGSVRELTCLLMTTLDPKKVVIAGGYRGLYGEDQTVTAAEISYFNGREDSGFAMDPDRLVRTAESADLVIVANPDRVTGKLLDEEVISRLCRLADRKGLHLALDESLIELSGRGGIDRSRYEIGNVVTMRTTAHYYGLPGLELAYGISGEQTVGEMRRRTCCRLNMLSVEAAKAAFKDAAYGKQVMHFLAEEKKSLSRAFERAGALFPGSDSNVYLLKLQNRPARFAAALARAGFLVKDCADMEGFGETYLRMSVLGHDKNVKLARLMGELLVPVGAGSMDAIAGED